MTDKVNPRHVMNRQAENVKESLASAGDSIIGRAAGSSSGMRGGAARCQRRPVPGGVRRRRQRGRAGSPSEGAPITSDHGERRATATPRIPSPRGYPARRLVHAGGNPAQGRIVDKSYSVRHVSTMTWASSRVANSATLSSSSTEMPPWRQFRLPRSPSSQTPSTRPNHAGSTPVFAGNAATEPARRRCLWLSGPVWARRQKRRGLIGMRTLRER